MRSLCHLIMLGCAAAKAKSQLNFLLDSLAFLSAGSSHTVSAVKGTMSLRFECSSAVHLNMAKLTEEKMYSIIL